MSTPEMVARRIIRERMNGSGRAVFVLGVYGALVELSTPENAAAFSARHRDVAWLAGCGVSSLKLALAELEHLGLVSIDTPTFCGPSTFFLLSPDVSRDTAIVSEIIKPHTPTRAPAGSNQLAQLAQKSQHAYAREEGDKTDTHATFPENAISALAPTVSPTDQVPVRAVENAQPSTALESFRLMLARGTFRTPPGRVVAQRFIATMTAKDLTMLTPEEEAKAKALRGR
jgi:hypothetical protein